MHLLCFSALVLGAGDGALSFDDALALARTRAPMALAAAAKIDEARGRLTGASALLRSNPVLSGGGGYRFRDSTDHNGEARAALSQAFELGGQRSARMQGAEGDIARAAAEADETKRLLLREVALVFARALYAIDKRHLAETNVTIARDVLRVAEQRLANGDVPRLDVQLARASLARAVAETRALDATSAEQLGRLRALLGLGAEEPLLPKGSLRERRNFASQADERPELRIARAEVDTASAEYALGAAERWPALSIELQYERHENAHFAVGVLSLTLPVFERGQGLRAQASARSTRAELERTATLNRVTVEARAAHDAYVARVGAADELEKNALPLLDETEAQLKKSYEAGRLGIAEVLSVRREIMSTRAELLDRLLDVWTAGVDMEAAAGALK